MYITSNLTLQNARHFASHLWLALRLWRYRALNKEVEKIEVYLNDKLAGTVDDQGDLDANKSASMKFLIDNGMMEKDVDLPVRIFNQAQAFSKSARELYDEGLSKPPYDSYKVSPYVVNSTFSIELYLKAILSITNDNVKGHDLIKLYAKLNDEDTKIINMLLVDHSIGLVKIEGTEQFELSYYLNSIKNAFVEWRYIFEKDKASINLISPYITIRVLEDAFVHIWRSRNA